MDDRNSNFPQLATPMALKKRKLSILYNGDGESGIPRAVVGRANSNTKPKSSTSITTPTPSSKEQPKSHITPKLGSMLPPPSSLRHFHPVANLRSKGTVQDQRIALQPKVSQTNIKAISPGEKGKDENNGSLNFAREMIDFHKARESSLVEQIQELKTEKIALEKEMKDLERVGMEKEFRIKELEHREEMKRMEGEYRHEKQVAEAEEKLKREAEFRQKLEYTVDDLNLQLKSKEQQIEIDNQKYEERYEEIKRVLAEKDSSSDALKSRLEQDIKRLEASNNKLEAQCEKLKQELLETRTKLEKYSLDTESEQYKQRSLIKQMEYETIEDKKRIECLIKDLENARSETKEAQDKLFTVENARRKLHAQVQDLKGNIRVFCRVRPVLQNEGKPIEMQFPDQDGEGQQFQLSLSENTLAGGLEGKTHSFSFDKVFSPNISNDTVFEEVSQLVQSALDGYNVCIFAYGQTGSGKTYTMSAIIPLAIEQIFFSAKNMKGLEWEFQFNGEFLEIYNEKIIDLLRDVSGYTDDQIKYDIRHDPDTRTTFVSNLSSIKIESPTQALSLLSTASKNKTTAATNLNSNSSRSHTVFVLRLTGTNRKTGEIRRGVLNLIDLAGSERVALSGATGDRMKEAQAINKSLSALGDVIGSLGNGHVPYRNSKVCFEFVSWKTSSN